MMVPVNYSEIIEQTIGNLSTGGSNIALSSCLRGSLFASLSLHVVSHVFLMCGILAVDLCVVL